MSHSLTIEPIGETITVEDGQTILDACLRAGVWLPHACGHGLCGTCKVDVVDGEVDHADASGFALMDFERADGKTLACTARLNADTVIEADLDEDPDARRIAVRDLSCTVTAIKDLTHDIKGVHLLPDSGTLDFQAGQYINLTLPGLSGSRAFSLANPPGAAEIELHIRRVPGGVATGYVHDVLRPGDRVTVTGPYGRFFVRKSSPLPLLFIAGGTGLSSPKSMILDLLADGRSEPITLFHGVRSRRDLYDHAVFTELAARHSHLRYVPVLSEARPEDQWPGETGMVHEALQRVFPQGFAGHKAYLCGPPPMIEACIRTLMQGRLFERDIYTEKFLSAADANASTVRSPVFRRL